MSRKTSLLFLACMMALAIAVGCSDNDSQAEGVDQVQIANPASVNCQDGGNTLEIRQDSGGGEYGVCMFPDGTECEEWAYFRGECEPGDMVVVSAPA